ncbi:MAG TPA: AgmX/PglI C-terminal domain-containing protein [Labilithrix sp.]|nr:AgmX/PglI C-terminal domain-containing protein [Labilithrix sp.]
MSLSSRCVSVVLCALAASACGGGKPPETPNDTPKQEVPKEEQRNGPMVEQELGSIDERAVERKFDELQSKLQTCHQQARERVEYLAGDVKVFLRVGKDGRVKYSFFEESTLGDREMEKCILDVFSAATWPKPQGGEAEVRNGFGWPAGGERAPTPWGPEKVLLALEEEKGVKKVVDKCKSGVSGEFRVTAYVEPGEVEESRGSSDTSSKPHGKAHPKGRGHQAAHKGDKKAARKHGEHGGKFKAIGVAPPSKDGAEKVDCIVDAMRQLPLPSPGSYAAKVSFLL